MIEITPTNKADTRSGSNVTKNELREDTLAHIEHVKLGAQFLADAFLAQVEEHDHTKLEYLDAFYKDFVGQSEERKFKDLYWWKIHLNERHHLGKDGRVPADVTLLDLLEMADDYAMAAAGRSGDVDFNKFPVDIDPATFKLAFENTVRMLIYNTAVKKREEDDAK